MKSKRYTEEIKALRLHRSTSTDLKNDRLKLKKSLLPIYQEIDNILRTAQRLAEIRLLSERPEIADVIHDQQIINGLMKQGDVQGAGQIQEADLEKQKLLEFGGTQ